MGARGPAPTPAKTLQARGSWRAKLAEGQMSLPVERPSCPAWLEGEAKAEWKRQVEQLLRAGVLAKIDRGVLALCCEAWGEFIELRDQVKSLRARQPEAVVGTLVAISKGLLAAKNKAAERYVKLADRFGFSPAARTRIRATEQTEDEQSDGKSRFFGTVG
jgi:P27 family predicted phage terminase small subunit